MDFGQKQALCKRCLNFDLADLGLRLSPDLLAQDVNRHRATVPAEMPVGPAIAAGRAFNGGADLMD